MESRRRARSAPEDGKKKRNVRWEDAFPSAVDEDIDPNSSSTFVINSLGRRAPAKTVSTQVTANDILFEVGCAQEENRRAEQSYSSHEEAKQMVRALRRQIQRDELIGIQRVSYAALRKAATLYSSRLKTTTINRSQSNSIFLNSSSSQQQPQQLSQLGNLAHNEATTQSIRQQRVRNFNAVNPQRRRLSTVPSLTPLDAINTALRHLSTGFLVRPAAFQQECEKVAREVAELTRQRQKIRKAEEERQQHFSPQTHLLKRKTASIYLTSQPSQTHLHNNNSTSNLFLSQSQQLGESFSQSAVAAAAAAAVSAAAIAAGPSEPPLMTVVAALLSAVSDQMLAESRGTESLSLTRLRGSSSLPPGVSRISTNNYVYAGTRALLLFDLQLPRMAVIVGAATKKTRESVSGGTLVLMVPIADPAPFVLRKRHVKIPFADCIGMLVERQFHDPKNENKARNHKNDDDDTSSTDKEEEDGDDDPFALPKQRTKKKKKENDCQKRGDGHQFNPEREEEEEEEPLVRLAAEFKDSDDEAGDDSDEDEDGFDHSWRPGGNDEDDDHGADDDSKKTSNLFARLFGKSMAEAVSGAPTPAGGRVDDNSVSWAASLPRVDNIRSATAKKAGTRHPWHMRFIENERVRSSLRETAKAGGGGVGGLSASASSALLLGSATPGGGSMAFGASQLSYGGRRTGDEDDLF